MKKITHNLDLENPDKKYATKGMIFLKSWSLMFAIIGLQLSFTLSPFFGLRGTPFMFIINENANFFSNMMQTIAELFVR